MLKVARSGRRRSNSFSLLDKGDSMPIAPNPTPSSSFIPNSMLENEVLAIHIDDHDQLLKAAEDMILKPSDIEVEDEDEKERLSQLKKMCKGFTMSDEQLQHIEKRMIMEINWGLGKAKHKYLCHTE